MLVGVIILLYYLIIMGVGLNNENVIYLDIVLRIVGGMVVFLSYIINNVEFSIRVILLIGKSVGILMI